MVDLDTLVRVGGVLHLAMLAAGSLLPRVVDLRESLAPLSRFLRQIIWVHAVFVVFVVIGFGAVATLQAAELTSGRPFARCIAGFIGFFWLARLVVQLFVFDARPYLTSLFLKLGYHGLTGVFAYLAVVFGLAACLPSGALS